MSRYFANEGLSTYTHVTDQHATDTHGVTLVNFGLSGLVGKLSVSGRQNALAAALKEYEAPRHATFALPRKRTTLAPRDL